jgi:curved DNA-binding protein CbpA
VSEAFNVLSDPARRSTYDQFGTDDPQEHMARRAGGGMRDPTPEEFFAQFFGGAAFAGGGGPGVYHHNPFFGGYTQQRGYARPRRAERAEQAPNLLQQFMQLLPLILLFAFAIFGGGSSGDDGNGIFSLTQQGSLSVRKVSDNGIPFFVSPAFDNQYSQSSKRKVAYEAERLAKRESFYACQNEIRVREAAVARAKGERNPNQKDIAKAEKYPTPNCDTYHKLRRAHND